MGMAIRAAGMAAPEQIQTATELGVLIGRSERWIVERTGVTCRRVAHESLTMPQLAAAAARGVIEEGGVPDLIINASTTPHQLIPDTSVFISQELGLEGVPCFSVNASCLSFLAALNVANSLLQTGAHRRILICSADLGTRGRNFLQPESAALLGDGAGAALVEWDADARRSFSFAMETWPAGAELAQVRGGGVNARSFTNGSAQKSNLFDMQGCAIYRLVRTKIGRFIEDFLAGHGLAAADIDLVVPHQASGHGIKSLERAGFAEERIINIIGEYGNCASASLPMALAEAVNGGRIGAGSTVLLIGSAAGVSLGAGLIRW